jgi:hypothetical protein
VSIGFALAVCACNDASPGPSRGVLDGAKPDTGRLMDTKDSAAHLAACQRDVSARFSVADSGPAPDFQRELMPFFALRCDFGGCHLGTSSSSQLELGEGCTFDVRTNLCSVDAGTQSAAVARQVYDNLLAPSITAPALHRVEPGHVEQSFLLLKLSGCQDAFEAMTGCTPCGRPMPGGFTLRETDPDLFAMVVRWVSSGAPFE